MSRRHRFLRARHRFRRYNEFFAQTVFQRLAQKLFADRISTRRIDIIDAALCKALHQRMCNGCIHFLNRDAAEAHAGHAQSGLSQSDIFHMFTPVSAIYHAEYQLDAVFPLNNRLYYIVFRKAWQGKPFPRNAIPHFRAYSAVLIRSGNDSSFFRRSIFFFFRAKLHSERIRSEF